MLENNMMSINKVIFINGMMSIILNANIFTIYKYELFFYIEIYMVMSKIYLYQTSNMKIASKIKNKHNRNQTC